MKRLKSLFFPKGKKQNSSPVLEQIDPQLRLDLDDSPDEEIYPIDDILLPCAVCGRTFATQSLAKHVRICMQTTPKVRKVFDSSNQRIKGTDLAQYTPTNLGQPNSPYPKRERTPPLNKMVNKKAQSTPSAAHTRLLATVENSPCPHCGRNFGARAWDRHIERCAEQSRLKHAPGASSGPENVRVARERLHARTSYKAPLAKSKRAINREKYSLSRSASECSGITEISFDGTRRSSRDSIEDFKHLPSIKKLSQSSTKSNGSSTRNLSKSRMDDMYDPYLAAENQLKDLISSSTNISKLDMSSIPKLYSSTKSKPKSLQHSPPLKARDDLALKKNPQNTSFQRSMSLRSPSRNNPVVSDVTKKYSTVNKNNSNVNYNLNSILYGNKPTQHKDSPNSKLNLKGSNMDKPKNNLKQNSSFRDDNTIKLSNRTDKNHTAKLKPVERISKRDDNHNDYSYSAPKIYNEFSGSQESFIDPRLINEDRPLPITVQKFLDNPDLLSSEESLIRENLPTNFGSFTDYVKKERERYSRENSVMSHTFSETREPTTPLIDDLSAQYDKIMVSLEQSMTSNMSLQDEDALYNDLEELMSSIDGDIPNDNVHSYKTKNMNSKHANDTSDSLNRRNNKMNLSSNNNNYSTPKIVPYNKSVSLNFSPLPKKTSPFTRSTSLHNSETDNKISDKSSKDNSSKLEEEIMHSLRDFDKYCDGVYDSPIRRDSANIPQRNHEKYLNDMYKQETDLKYFMPKNLGLTNESPFMDKEKSLSPRNQKSPINREHSMRNKLLAAAENIPCPNCGHCFDIRAWCAEQIRLDSLKRPTQLAQVDFHRPSTLHA